MDAIKLFRPMIEKDADYMRELLDTSTSASDMSDANDSVDQDEEDIIEVDLVLDEDHEIEDIKLPNKNRWNSHSFVFGRDNETKWELSPRSEKYHQGQKRFTSGVLDIVKNAKSALDCWKAFFSDKILDIIVHCTNKEIENKMGQVTGEQDCRFIDSIELKAFFGLLYLTGYYRGSKLSTEELWNTDGTGIELFSVTMSRDRFRFILSHLRFDDRDTLAERRNIDKLASIRDVFELFVGECKKHYSVSQYTTIGELQVKFNGRCGFRQYLPRKPGKSGIKIFSLVDAKTFYTLNLEVYVGRQPEGPFMQDCSSHGVVKRLCQPIFGSGRNVTGDTWFSSFKLAKDLFAENITYVGTLSKSKREIPLNFISTKNREQNSSLYCFHEGYVTLVSYIPKKGKNVLLLSTLQNSTSTDRSDLKRPGIFTFYNETKNGVDCVNKLCSNYSVSKNTNRWPMAIFYSLLNIGAVNAHILYKSNNLGRNERKRRLFIKKLSLELVSGLLKRRSEVRSLPVQLRLKTGKIYGKINDKEEPMAKKRCYDGMDRLLVGEKRRCAICYRTQNAAVKHTCVECKNYICFEHVNYVCSVCRNANNLCKR